MPDCCIEGVVVSEIIWKDLCKQMMTCTSHFHGMQVIKQLHPHSSHSATAFTLGPGLTEVTLFGGSPEITTGYPKLVDTTLLKFGE